MTNEVRPPETWLPLDVDEADYVAFDYTDMLVTGESITGTPAITCEAVAGTDAAASSRPSGSPIIDGAVVKQLMTGVQPGVTYLVRCVVSLNTPRRLTLAGVVDGVRIAP